MDSNVLGKLSAEQLEALNDEQKTIFCAMVSADQDFFAQAFSPKDLPEALAKKGEIMQRNQAARARMEAVQKRMAESAPSTPAASQKAGDVLTAVAGVLGMGAAAAMVASDNSAAWKGVKPADLVSALRTEFTSDQTSLNVEGDPTALAATVMLQGGGGYVPALTVHLSAVNDGTEVKMSDLTRQGTIETIKEGGQKLLDITGGAVRVLTHSKFGGVSPDEVFSTARQTLAKGASLAETAGNLKLKERAWKVIKQTADAIEANYLSKAEKARQARAALEKAWGDYYNCPNCGVAFGADETECRVCGTARPAKPNEAIGNS